MSEQEPILFNHAKALYAKLEETAMDGIFTGSMVQVFREIGVSQTYYSPLYRTLEEIGCIEVLRAGRGRGQKSQVKLLKPPDLENFTAVYKKSLTKPTAYDTLREQLEIVLRRLPDIDIASVLTDHEQRIEALERQDKGGS